MLCTTINVRSELVLRPPSPFILSPTRLRCATARFKFNGRVEAKRRRTGEEIATGRFSFFRLTVRRIPPREFSRRRRTILLLLGEKVGLREVVTPSHKYRAAGNGLSKKRPAISHGAVLILLGRAALPHRPRGKRLFLKI
jgi:hypothetical protein